MPNSSKLPLLAYVYFVYLMFLPILALMGVFQSRSLLPNAVRPDLGLGMLFMLLGSIAYLTCIMFVHFPKKPVAQWFMILDAPIQIGIFKYFGANLTWLQYFLIDFVVEAFGFLILLATIPAFYPKLLPNAMEDKPFTKGGIGVATLFGLALLAILFVFGSTFWHLLTQQTFMNQIPIYTALISTIWMYLRYLSTSPPADADARTVWVLVGTGLWIIMSFGLANYLVSIGLSF